MGQKESSRITDGLRYVASGFSVSRDEFRHDNHPDGSALLDGCHSLGYLRRGDGEAGERYALTDAGRRRLFAAEPAPVDE